MSNPFFAHFGIFKAPVRLLHRVVVSPMKHRKSHGMSATQKPPNLTNETIPPSVP